MGKAAKAKATARAATVNIITVDVGKSPKKKANKSLVSRLSVTPMRTLKKLEFTLAKADANRNVLMKAKTDKAALISKKIKAIKDQANTDEAKAAEKLISALAKAEANRDAVTKAKV